MIELSLIRPLSLKLVVLALFLHNIAYNVFVPLELNCYVIPTSDNEKSTEEPIDLTSTGYYCMLHAYSGKLFVTSS